MWPRRQGMMSQSVVIAPHAGSGVTSLLSKDHYRSGGHGNVEDINGTMSNCSMEWFSDSVLTETQLRSLTRPFEISDGEFVALLVTLTPGSTAIANFDTTVWPAWIRPAIRKKLLDAGGVPSVSPLQVQKDSDGKQYVLPLMKPAIKLTASPAEPATDDDDPESNPTSSSPPTEQKPSDTWKPCPPGTHDWLTRNGVTYCWLCGIEPHAQ